jgi:hypothetical protein
MRHEERVFPLGREAFPLWNCVSAQDRAAIAHRRGLTAHGVPLIALPRGTIAQRVPFIPLAIRVPAPERGMSPLERALTDIRWAILHFAREIVPLPRAIRGTSWGNTPLCWAMIGTERAVIRSSWGMIRPFGGTVARAGAL